MNTYIEYVIAGGARCLFHRISQKNDRSNLPKGILVNLFASIGDSIITAPFFRELKRNFPEHSITLVTNKMNCEIFSVSPYVDDVRWYDDKTRKHNFLTNLKRSYNFAKENLQDKNYEFSFVLEPRVHRFYAAYLSVLSGARYRYTFSECNDKKEHDQYMGIYDRFFTGCLTEEQDIHDVEKNLDLLRYAGLSIEQNGLEVWTSSEDELSIEKKIIQNNLQKNKSLLIVALTTSSKNKDWSVDGYAEVCRRLLTVHDCLEIVVIGNGSAARSASEKFMQLVPSAHDFTDKTSIRETIALLKRATYYLGNDTGPTHIAAACGLRGVAIYKHPKDQRPHTHNSTKMLYPWQANIRVIQPEHAIAGCEGGCNMQEAHCILQVSVDEVYKTLDDVIENNSKS